MKISEFIRKLQKQPEGTKKIIFWTIMIVVGLGLVFLWLAIFPKRIQKRMQSIDKENIIEQFIPSTEEFKKEIKNLPKMNEEELKKLEEEVKKLKEKEKEKEEGKENFQNEKEKEDFQ